MILSQFRLQTLHLNISTLVDIFTNITLEQSNRSEKIFVLFWKSYKRWKAAARINIYPKKSSSALDIKV